jgi:hypothetical protein
MMGCFFKLNVQIPSISAGRLAGTTGAARGCGTVCQLSDVSYDSYHSASESGSAGWQYRNFNLKPSTWTGALI